MSNSDLIFKALCAGIILQCGFFFWIFQIGLELHSTLIRKADMPAEVYRAKLAGYAIATILTISVMAFLIWLCWNPSVLTGGKV